MRGWVFFYSLQHPKSRHFHSSTAKLVPGGANYFLSVSVVIGHFGRKTATINSKYQPNHVARLITYSKCPTICVLLLFCRGRHFFSSWFPERPIDGVDGRWKSGPVFLLHCVNLCLCPNLTLVISGVKHQVIRLGFLHLDYVSRSEWKLMAVGHVVLPINSQSHVNQREMKNEKNGV